MYRIALPLLALATLTTACVEEPTEEAPASNDEILAELEALDSQEDTRDDTPLAIDGKADRASNIYHECITATFNGSTKWTYKTNFLNNTRQTIAVYVYQHDGRSTPRAFGPLFLNKIGTDLWKEPNGKMTLRLVQKGAGKSIRVYHNSVRLLASDANGWCKTVDPVQGLSSEHRHDFFYGSRSRVNGFWRFLAVGGELVDAETPYGFTFSEQHESTPAKQTVGTMGSYRRCNPISTPTYQPPVTGTRARALSLLQLALDAVDLVSQSVELYRCTQAQDHVIPTRRLYRGYLWNQRGRFTNRTRPRVSDSFLSACGTGNDTYFLEVDDGTGHRNSILCIQMFTPHTGASYMRTKGYYVGPNPSASGRETPWATFVKE